jgi:2-C-methyl-D-erythritol 2,4-cyclodiphosphate synthase
LDGRGPAARERAAPTGWRVGQGFDAHRFSDDPARILRLALLEWPGERALAGHSDGDVAAHALVDALASAAGLGDIGALFGTARPEFADAPSALFLERVAREVRARGFEIEHAAVQIIGERPRIGTRRGEAEVGIGHVLGTTVTVSATSTDGMGFTGRGEGLAALATCLLRPAASSLGA